MRAAIPLGALTTPALGEVEALAPDPEAYACQLGSRDLLTRGEELTEAMELEIPPIALEAPEAAEEREA
jgi:hypothetical protein